FRRLLAARERLVTHSYVVVESGALVQRGLGLEAVRALCHGLLEVVHTVPVDEDLHRAALTALLASGRRDISLVDWTSFFFMQRKGLRKALAFDERFWEQGFSPVEA
ncbi:BTAD domain-containing putative transcriptional regulator, partial [Thermosynechococcus sp.]|uniref:BTAD domain-containing putative transcriptional regulator n=1 Tax=Thermosynechococcus sp. TaxID=2814275 RepID=UPI003918A652